MKPVVVHLRDPLSPEKTRCGREAAKTKRLYEGDPKAHVLVPNGRVCAVCEGMQQIMAQVEEQREVEDSTPMFTNVDQRDEWRKTRQCVHCGEWWYDSRAPWVAEGGEPQCACFESVEELTKRVAEMTLELTRLSALDPDAISQYAQELEGQLASAQEEVKLLKAEKGFTGYVISFEGWDAALGKLEQIDASRRWAKRWKALAKDLRAEHRTQYDCAQDWEHHCRRAEAQVARLELELELAMSRRGTPMDPFDDVDGGEMEKGLEWLRTEATRMVRQRLVWVLTQRANQRMFADWLERHCLDDVE